MNKIQQEPIFYEKNDVLSLTSSRNNQYYKNGSRKIVNLEAYPNGTFFVSGMEDYTITTATSCLIQPLPKDRVYVIFDRHFMIITDILSRKNKKEKITLDSTGHNLRIQAPEIELDAHEKIVLKAPKFSLLTRTSHWVTETLHQISQRLFINSCYANRKIKETDKTEAKHLVFEADETLIIKSEIGSIEASSVLKIDGSQVHVG